MSNSVTVSEPIAPPSLSAPLASDAGTKQLDKAQLDMVEAVLSHFSSVEYRLPSIVDAELTDDENLWLSYECIQRFLRAVGWKTAQAAIDRLERTLKWRREWGIYSDLRDGQIESDAASGCAFIFGFDYQHSPVIHFIPSRLTTDDPVRQTRSLVWMVERAIDLTGPDAETIDIFVNYANDSRNLAWKAAYAIVADFQGYYPERLGVGIVNNAPWYLNAFFKLIHPLLDPVTREKLRFSFRPIEENIIAPDMIMSDWWGGNVNFQYIHEKYYPALVDMCEARRKAWMQKWKALGGTVGLKERDFKSEEGLELADGNT